VLSYIVRRLIGAVILLFIVTAVTFAIFFLLPRLAGATADDIASRYAGKSANASQIHDIAVKLGFDDPLYEQYGRYLKGLIVGQDVSTGAGTDHCPAPCLGYSYIDQRPVLPSVLGALPVTLSLAIGAAVIWLVAGVATGVVSALKRGSIFDRLAMSTALGGVSLPIFFTGQLCLLVFSYTLGWTAQGGEYTPVTENPGRWAYDLLLPWITLAFLYAAGYARLTRAGMLETMGEDFIRTARAKGLRERTVVTKHGLRAALTPITTIFGLDLGLLLGGAVLTESTYSLHGIGALAIDSVIKQDLPKVLGVVLIAAVFIIIANLVVDLLYAVIDPRVRLS
jgi:peptide/nickel transport system permease protein